MARLRYFKLKVRDEDFKSFLHCEFDRFIQQNAFFFFHLFIFLFFLVSLSTVYYLLIPLGLAEILFVDKLNTTGNMPFVIQLLCNFSRKYYVLVILICYDTQYADMNINNVASRRLFLWTMLNSTVYQRNSNRNKMQIDYFQ